MQDESAGPVLTADPPRPAVASRSDAVAVAVLTGLANALGYGFNVAVSVLLGPARYGAVAALAAGTLVASVPAIALQAVAARRTVVAAGGPEGAAALPWLWRDLLRVGRRTGALVAALALVAAPFLTRFLHLGSPLPALWLAASVVPLTLVATLQGLLQGARRFAAFGWLAAAAAAGRLAGAVAGATWSGTVTAVMAGTVAGAAAAVAVGWWLVRPVLGAATGRP
ncbi:MAG: hypothetical protein ACJ74O_00005, partial [Frankiaceae bacterium]